MTNSSDQTTAASGVLQQTPRRPIVFVNRFFHPDETATSQLLSDLAFDLAEKGHPVRVVTSRLRDGYTGLLPRSEVINGVEVFRVASRGQTRPGRRWKLLAFLFFYPRAFVALMRITGKGDLVVAKTDPPLIAIIAMIVAILRRAALVTWLQDLYPEVAIELKAPIFKGRVGGFLVKRRNTALKFAKANIVIGEMMAKKVERGGVLARNIHVVHNWADNVAIQPIHSNQSKFRRRWALGPNTFEVGYSGNLGRAHEMDTVLEASVLLRDSDVKFLFVGGGHANELLQRAVRKRGLSNFIFEPHQPREELSDILAAADAHWVSLRPELEGLIVPSKFYGILASGRPVIAVTSKSGEIASEVRKHKCGFVVAPGDHEEFARLVLQLVEEPELCKQAGKAARHASDTQFSKDSALTAWSTIIGSLAPARSHMPYPVHASPRPSSDSVPNETMPQRRRMLPAPIGT